MLSMVILLYIYHQRPPPAMINTKSTIQIFTLKAFLIILINSRRNETFAEFKEIKETDGHSQFTIAVG
jgi:hypothetical protein